jgi:hypothetical protein
MMLMNLNGVSAAEGDMRPAFARQVSEFAKIADRAAPARYGARYLGAFRGPEIEREQCSTHERGLMGEKFKCLGDLNGSREVDCRRENARGIAGLDGTGRRLGKKAGEAGGRFPG